MRAAYFIQGIGYLLLAGAIGYLVWAGKVHAPLDDITSTNTDTMTDMIIRSPAFNNGELIPGKYTCDGDDMSPPLAFDAVPENAQSLVLIVHDPDVPTSIREDGTWDHWVLFNMPPTVTRIGEGETPDAVSGVTTRGDTAYGGPCPPNGEHRYFFTLYALDTELALGEGATKQDVLAAMDGHVLAEAQLMGRYARPE